MIKKISAIVAICVLGLATAVLSVLLIVNAGMNGYSPYENGVNKVDAKAEIIAAYAMPKVKKLNVDVWRDTTLNFGEYGARISYLTSTIWPQSVITGDTPFYTNTFVFRGDKYLEKNTKGGAPDQTGSLADGSIYRISKLTEPAISQNYGDNDTVFYASFRFSDPAANTVRTVSEIKNKYVDGAGNKVVSFVGYKTTDKEDDIILGIRTVLGGYEFENPFNIIFIGEETYDISTALMMMGEGDQTELRLLENLNFFGKNVKLDLAARKAYVESQNGKPEVLMISVIATGAQIKYMESAYPELKLFEALEKVR